MAYNVFNRSRMQPQMAVPGGSMRQGIVNPSRMGPPQIGVDGGSMRQGIVSAPTMREALMQTQPQQNVAEILSQGLPEMMPDLGGATSAASRQRQIADMLLQGAQSQDNTSIAGGLSQLGQAFLARRAGQKADTAETEAQSIQSLLVKQAMEGDQASIAQLLAGDPAAAINYKTQMDATKKADQRYTTEYADTRADRAEDVGYRDTVYGDSRTDRAEDLGYRDTQAAETARQFGLNYGLGLRGVQAAEGKAAAEAEALKNPPPNVDDEASFRREYNSITSGFRDVQSSYGRIKATDATTPAGQLSLVYQYMKMLDPGSTVMQGEQASASNAAGVPEKVKNLYNSIIGGKPLSANQVTDFTNQADLLYARSLQDYDQARKTYEGLANEYGFAVSRTVPDLATNRTNPNDRFKGGLDTPRPPPAPSPPDGWDDSDVPWADTWANMSEADRALFMTPQTGVTTRTRF
jgi:hypothetical protein